MLGKIKLSIIASLCTAALVAPGVVHADSPAGAVLVDSGSSTYQAGFKSGPHTAPYGIKLEANFSGFGLPPDHVNAYLVQNGTVIFDCNLILPVVNGHMSLSGGPPGEVEVGFCPVQGIPENDQAFTWAVYTLTQ